ncbi:hypothetical protein J4E81_003583 [Alternaria sp. BMP 2799]|nr:hypothetical protein J4E81_003583 [Alternaria sp. BMP 2799]
MGRPSDPPPSYRDDPDAVSLHTTPDDYTYDDAPEISGLPPSYTDSEAGASGTPASSMPIHHIAPPTTSTNHAKPSFKNGNPVVNTTINVQDPLYDNDPAALENSIRLLAEAAPTPLIYIMGTHRETTKKNNETKSRTITDFRLVINLSKYIHANYLPNNFGTMSLTTAENSEKTHRGTILKCRAPGSKQDIEVGGTQKPGLTEWCHRYCASPRALRIFRVRRDVTGLDEAYLRSRIEGIIRSTNYRGNISITFPVEDANVDFYTSHRVNAWRLKTWVRWVFYLTFLWIFSWPVLFFATRRWSVVRAEWPFSRTNTMGRKEYTTVSEEEWMGEWHVAIRRLVLERYEGEASEEMMRAVMQRSGDPPVPGTFRSGHVGVDNAVGVLTQGFQVARALSNGEGVGRVGQSGWGYDY